MLRRQRFQLICPAQHDDQSWQVSIAAPARVLPIPWCPFSNHPLTAWLAYRSSLQPSPAITLIRQWRLISERCFVRYSSCRGFGKLIWALPSFWRDRRPDWSFAHSNATLSYFARKNFVFSTSITFPASSITFDRLQIMPYDRSGGESQAEETRVCFAIYLSD